MPETTDATVCAIVVTYNRRQLLLECLAAIRQQTRLVEAICIIDNYSSDGTPQALLEGGYVRELPPHVLTEPWVTESQIGGLAGDAPIRLMYVRMEANRGGAGGFYEGMKRGHEAGYDWLWLMDDDGVADNRCLETLLFEANHHHIEVLNPLVLNRERMDKLAFRLSDTRTRAQAVERAGPSGIIDNLVNPFNGTLLSKDVVARNGYIKKEMFIWGDEIEYFLRMSRKGIRYGTSTKALFCHPEGKTRVEYAFFGRLKVSLKPERLEGNFFRNMGFIERAYYSRVNVKLVLSYLLYFAATRQPTRMVRFLRYYYDGWSDRYGLPALAGGKVT